MRDDVRDIQYRIGDMLGDYAPESFRRPSTSAEWIIGLGSIAAAACISYLAMRMADRRLDDVIRSIVPGLAMRNGQERPMQRTEMRTERGESRDRSERPAVHGTEGARMPDTSNRTSRP